MIETFYGMQRMPFTAEDPALGIFRSPTWDEVLSRLQYLVDHAGLGVITGECGVGKSTVIRHFCRSLDPATSLVCYLADSKLTPRTLYPALLAQLGYEPLRSGLEANRAVHREFAQLRRGDRWHPLVVIDEAQGLRRDLIEELRYLRNETMDGHSLMAVVLVCQPELRDRLRLQSSPIRPFANGSRSNVSSFPGTGRKWTPMSLSNYRPWASIMRSLPKRRWKRSIKPRVASRGW